MNAILLNDTSNEMHVGSKAVIDNIYKMSRKNGINIVDKFTRKDILSWSHRIEIGLSQAQLVLFNGEGSLHDSPTFLDTLINRREKLKNHKLVLLNSLWQNMNNPYLQEFFNMFDIISFRDSKSANEFKSQYKNEDKISVIPDIIFCTKIKNTSIGFGDTVIDENKIYFRKNENYFPMNCINNSADVTAYFNWLKSLELHVTGRFHGVCLSALASIPFLAMSSNSHKIEALLDDMNCPELLISNINEIREKRQLAIDALPKIKQYVSSAYEKTNDLFQKIGTL